MADCSYFFFLTLILIYKAPFHYSLSQILTGQSPLKCLLHMAFSLFIKDSKLLSVARLLLELSLRLLLLNFSLFITSFSPF